MLCLELSGMWWSYFYPRCLYRWPSGSAVLTTGQLPTDGGLLIPSYFCLLLLSLLRIHSSFPPPSLPVKYLLNFKSPFLGRLSHQPSLPINLSRRSLWILPWPTSTLTPVTLYVTNVCLSVPSSILQVSWGQEKCFIYPLSPAQNNAWYMLLMFVEWVGIGRLVIC